MKMNMNTLRKLAVLTRKYRPQIQMGVGIACGAAATVFGIKATVEAAALIEKKKKERDVEKLTPKETVKTVWRCYIPTAAFQAMSIGFLIGSGNESAKRTAALSAAYSFSDTALREYQAATKDAIGEKKEQEIQGAIDKKHLEKNPVVEREIIVTGRGTTRCYDGASGRYFYSDIDTIKKAENMLNRQMLKENYISLNDFYEELGLDPTDTGDLLGWSATDGLISLHFSSLLDENGEPCLVVKYNVAPRYDFRER